MLGSIIGDTVGSIYEFANINRRNFKFFQKTMEITDDSILTIATARWILQGGDAAKHYCDLTQKYPNPMGSYGSGYWRWARQSMGGTIAPPYNSCGNGSAMRIGPVGWAFDTEEEILRVAKTSAECTHNHPEGIKGAQATAVAIWMARNGKSADEIAAKITADFGYDLTMSVETLRKRYSWQGIDGKGNGGTCQDSVPQAIICALKADGFEDAIRNAIAIGGDSDTIGCITGSIAEALYGIPSDIYEQGIKYLPEDLLATVIEFEERYGNGRI